MCFKWLSEWETFGEESGRQRGASALGFIGLFCTHLTSLFEASSVQLCEDHKETRGRVQTGRQARSLPRAPSPAPSRDIMAGDVAANCPTDGARPAPEGRLHWQRKSSGEIE